jgi:hypothetical protein
MLYPDANEHSLRVCCTFFLLSVFKQSYKQVIDEGKTIGLLKKEDRGHRSLNESLIKQAILA